MKLFTNIRYVTLRQADSRLGVRVNCAALLLHPANPIHRWGRANPRIQGFGVDLGWPVFDMWLPDGPFSTHESMTGIAVLGHSGQEMSVGGGLCLTFRNGPEFLMVAEDSERTPRMDDCQGYSPTDVRALLEKRCAEYWSRPEMPYLFHGPPWRPDLAARSPESSLAPGLRVSPDSQTS